MNQRTSVCLTLSASLAIVQPAISPGGLARTSGEPTVVVPELVQSPLRFVDLQK